MLLLHGAADTGWSFHRVAADLERRGHAVAAPDLPCEDEDAGHDAYADAALAPLAEMGRADEPLVVLGHSLGGFTAPVVAERAKADHLVFLTAMIPRPGESVDAWWGATGHGAAFSASGADGTDDMALFLHDVEPGLAAEALRRGRGQTARMTAEPFPLQALPAIPTTFLLCRDDRFFPAAWMRGVVADRLGIEPTEIPGSHRAPLSRPGPLAEAIDALTRGSPPAGELR